MNELTEDQLAEYAALIERTTPVGAVTASPGILVALLSEVRSLKARVTKLETELRIGEPWTCRVCSKENTRDACAICETDRPETGEPQ